MPKPEQLTPEGEIREREAPTPEKPEAVPVETPEALNELAETRRTEVRDLSEQTIAGGQQTIENVVKSIGGKPEDIEAGRVVVAPVQEEIARLTQETRQAIEVVAGVEAKPEPPYPEAEARKKWKELTLEQKLTYCDPDVVNQEKAGSLALSEEPKLEKFGETEPFAENVEKLHQNVEALIESYVKEKHISPEYAKRTSDSVKEYVNLINQAQQEGGIKTDLKAEDVNKIARDLVEKVAYQNKESLKRALGDHGVRHIIDGNITEAMKIADEYNKSHPDKPLSAAYRLKIMTMHYNHDMGYTVGINRTGFESTGDHKYFSQKLFDSDKEVYGKIFTNEDMTQMSEMIRTHDEAETDFTNKPLESVIRLSDNLGLFHDSKLPEIFYSDPENLVILQKIYIAREAGQNISGLQKELIRRVQEQPDLDENTRAALTNAAGEVFKGTPEFNLGMFAGKLDSYRMEADQMIVRLRESDMHKQIKELFNLNQKQFVKLLDSYGIDLKKLGKKFEEFVQIDEKTGAKYVDLPPTGEGLKSLRFEFYPEDQTAKDPRNEQVREKFTETQKEWTRINTRNEIEQVMTELENPENRTTENVSALMEDFRSGAGERLGHEDLGSIAELDTEMRSNLGNETAFQKSLEKLKSFMTKAEKTFLAVE